MASINASGHKYGLVYPGVGWVIWRDPAALPEDLIFQVNYLGGEMPTFALNFSRPGAQVAAQYYNFIRLGFHGYRAVQQACRDIARYLAARSPGSARSSCSPMAATSRSSPSGCAIDEAGYTVFDVSERLRQSGWLVPAYTFPDAMQDTAVLRIVVRNGFSRDLADLLLGDLRTQVDALARLQQRPGPLPPAPSRARSRTETARRRGRSQTLPRRRCSASARMASPSVSVRRSFT